MDADKLQYLCMMKTLESIRNRKKKTFFFKINFKRFIYLEGGVSHETFSDILPNVSCSRTGNPWRDVVSGDLRERQWLVGHLRTSVQHTWQCPEATAVQVRGEKEDWALSMLTWSDHSSGGWPVYASQVRGALLWDWVRTAFCREAQQNHIWSRSHPWNSSLSCCAVEWVQFRRGQWNSNLMVATS